MGLFSQLQRKQVLGELEVNNWCCSEVTWGVCHRLWEAKDPGTEPCGMTGTLGGSKEGSVCWRIKGENNGSLLRLQEQGRGAQRVACRAGV